MVVGNTVHLNQILLYHQAVNTAPPHLHSTNYMKTSIPCVLETAFTLSHSPPFHFPSQPLYTHTQPLDFIELEPGLSLIISSAGCSINKEMHLEAVVCDMV